MLFFRLEPCPQNLTLKSPIHAIHPDRIPLAHADIQPCYSSSVTLISQLFIHFSVVSDMLLAEKSM